MVSHSNCFDGEIDLRIIAVRDTSYGSIDLVNISTIVSWKHLCARLENFRRWEP